MFKASERGSAKRRKSGFADPVLDSQVAFHGCRAVLATPGAVVRLGAGLESLGNLHAAASALLLVLLDQDTRLWLSPGAAADGAAASLKFHTGCSMAAFPREADFGLVAGTEELPPLESFSADSKEYPERSATVVLQVPAILESGWRLTGPGIRDEVRLSVPALGDGFLSQWERNRARFPRGVDLYLSCGDRLCGLPRTTRIDIST
ncbi:MAG TPA: phosphonate C-P lyase system protein PhnH [Burkholderiales bacterium]|nr:phosphonate C-P lyase system protein PhnH [Burkholderiales bacterium]